MIRAALGMVLLLLSLAATAQKTTRPEAAEDHNRTAGNFDALHGHGVGFDFIGTRDTDGFETRRSILAGLLSFDSPYRFAGIAAGTESFKQGDWSARGYSIWGVAEDRNRATGGGISARVGLSHIGGHDHLLADATWNHRFSPRTGMELLFQRDVIDSKAAIEQGVTHSYAAATIDHAFTQRLTGIALAGVQHFSDGNDRAHLRGWLIYSLLPEYGLSLQARARAYDNSQRGSAFYFNPEHYENADIGLRLRKAVAGWRLYGLLAGGRERVDGSTNRKPALFAQLNVDRVLTGDVRIGVRYAYARAAGEDAVNASNSTDYAWRYLRLFVAAPL